MKRVVAFLILIVMAFLFVACDATDGDGLRHEGAAVIGGYFSEAMKSRADVYGITDGDISGGEGSALSENQEVIRAGQITAKAWDDNDAYDEWLKLFAAATDNDPAAKFNGYTGSAAWICATDKRVKVTVTDNDAPVVGAEVIYFDAGQKAHTARTNARGVAYLFPQEESGTVTVRSGTGSATTAFTAENRDLTVSLTESKAQENIIKLMFVIDATGSMGDEMRYLAAELADVVHRVATQAEDVRIDLALLFYRDDGDREKFAYYAFKTVTEEQGLNAQLSVLTKQKATGGGDYPEAVDEALVLAAGKDWGEENSTKLMFLVLDAPSHETDTQRANMKNAVSAAAAKGIRICPVLCSGADILCEYVTRTSALLTGGTSVFVTDDSGIGGEHLDPDLPDATVEKLNDLMVRLIVGYHTGDFGTPVPWNDGQDPQMQPDLVPETVEG